MDNRIEVDTVYTVECYQINRTQNVSVHFKLCIICHNFRYTSRATLVTTIFHSISLIFINWTCVVLLFKLTTCSSNIAHILVWSFSYQTCLSFLVPKSHYSNFSLPFFFEFLFISISRLSNIRILSILKLQLFIIISLVLCLVSCL